MLDRIGPKRIRSLQIGDFSYADQRLLRTAFHGFIPMALIGGLEAAHPHVISVGHPDGLADPKDIATGSRYYSMTRIKGVGDPEPPAGQVGAGSSGR
jgi:hypothetical protein